ncbi:hypothetical protein CIHG_02056 [Coccidioides immitis H538.4]|uniref:Uncharacterized protein n=1 Tax=Coccidioides immitis H538.4 TaxID=396776 RepID=A0A0J8RGH7_COCIT|nr:hypothetical protein CIHG_02056 [Coccidioides immitis H538.4]
MATGVWHGCSHAMVQPWRTLRSACSLHHQTARLHPSRLRAEEDVKMRYFGRWALAGDGESLWKGEERTSHRQSVNQLGSISYYWWIMGEISTSVESTCGVCSVRCKAGLYGRRILRNSPPCIGGVASTRYGYINKG